MPHCSEKSQRFVLFPTLRHGTKFSLLIGSAGAAACIALLPAGAGRAASQPVPDGSRLFTARCQMCHTIAQGGAAGIGPNLAGVVGRKAGALPTFSYSSALKTSGLIWDKPTLDRWLTKPQGLVPGTRMVISGVADPAQRAAIIAYLAQPGK